MLNKSKLIIAAALLAVGSSAMGASTPASAQSFGNRAHAMERAYQTNDAYRGNVDEQTYEIQKFGYVGP